VMEVLSIYRTSFWVKFAYNPLVEVNYIVIVIIVNKKNTGPGE
jgi:hypothetical protein